MIQEIVKQNGKLHPMTVYKYFRRYWQQGKIINALLPNYEATGSKERNFVEKKPGAKPLYAENKGVPLTREVKKQFDQVLNKYYKKEGYPTLRHVHEQLIKQYYSDEYFRNGKKELIPRPNRPTLKQLKHYNAKYHNTSEDRKKRIGSKK
ncbi:hypothetical protein [Bacillus coahuilensis]|uniref:hypothetical protein n=1 Tax=Bacillus coahuilensis TaxID=408580 RepID=UPI0002F19A76|nr:hypothetical protein [Bacillus coahuilensis]